MQSFAGLKTCRLPASQADEAPWAAIVGCVGAQVYCCCCRPLFFLHVQKQEMSGRGMKMRKIS